MKRLLSILLLVVAVSGLSATASASTERAEVLRAINWVENPTNHARRGAHGELGPYQFRAQTWQLHTRKSFSLAVIREHADEVAVKHYEWIKRGLERAGIDPNPYNIAMAWNSGLGSVLNGKVPDVTYNYAQRVSNLVETQRQQRLGRAVAAVPNRGSPAAAPTFRLEADAQPVQFSLQSATPVFVLESEPLYEPVVKTVPVAPAVVVAKVEKPLFNLSEVASSGFAFVLP
jgi:hypothetical protein